MAIDFRSIHPVTDEELMRISRENPGMRFERSAQGKLIVAPPLGMMGSFGETELIRQVSTWALQGGRGRVSSSNGGFTFPDTSVLAPDAGWVSNERLQALPEEARSGFARIAPDVAFELLSPSDTLRSSRAKASQYLANSVRLVVLLDPRSCLVECHRPDIALEAHLNADIVSLEPEMPGFQLDAGAIFKAMM